MFAHHAHDCSWYHAVTLTERAAALRRLPANGRNGHPVPDRAQRRLQRWRAQAPFTTPSRFDQRLAADALCEDSFLHLLAEPVAQLREQFPAPLAWLAVLTDAFARAAKPALTFGEMVPGQEMTGCLRLVDPVVGHGLDRLRAGIQKLAQDYAMLPFDPSTVEAMLFANLPALLVTMLNRTMVLELNVARLQGQLAGDTAAERFRNFLERLEQRDVALALLQEYPVLARQLVRAVDRWVTFSLEVLQHLCADWDDLRKTFSPNADPGSLTQIQGGAGDTHQGGRSVLIMQFSSGLRLVYKPHALAVDVHFQELLTWLNARGAQPAFRTMTVLNRDKHGWVEFVAAQSCTEAAALERFYERQGAYLALLYAVQATDFHHENLIAAGEHPVLIDLESLFHPQPGDRDLSKSEALAGETLAYSVLRVGLLPQRLWSNANSDGVDMSGLGAAAGQLGPSAVPYLEGSGTDEVRVARKRFPMAGAKNRPTLNGAEVNVLDYAGAIAAGFTCTYRLLLEHREQLLAEDGPLARFGDAEVRVILRATQTYALLLQESFHPDVLRDALERDLLFDRLWLAVERQPYLARAIPAERDDLWRGDIPMFTTRPNSCDLWNSTGAPIPDFCQESGLTRVQRRVQQLSETDLERQLWFLRGSLTALALGPGHASWRSYQPEEPRRVATRDDLLEAACAVGDKLETLALRGTGQADATWIGLTMVNDKHWALLPMGLDLYSGIPGVALFLAQLGSLSGEGRYTELARAALVSIRRHIEQAKPGLTSLGAFDGLGGLIYTLTQLGSVWQDEELFREAEAFVELLPPLIAKDETLDLIGGAAGGIASLLGLHRCGRSPRALEVALQCGTHLLAKAQPQTQGLAWRTKISDQALTGFAHGAAGIAWALLELGEVSNSQSFRKAARGAIAYERSLFSPIANNWPALRSLDAPDEGQTKQEPHCMTAWCHGAAGIGLARLRCLRLLDEPELRAEIAAALETTLAHGFGGNHSLCHGDLGNLELLLQASEMLPGSPWRAQTGRIASMIVESIERHGWLCGVPLGVETPGLMTGLAGIGYELLRLAKPERVPSVLTLEPPRR